MEQKTINDRLDRIERTLKNIQETITDPDIILTEEERELVEQSFENQKQGKLISSEDLRRKLEIWDSRLTMNLNQKDF